MPVANVCETSGSLQISYSVNGGLTAKRTMQCPWESWQAYATQLAPVTVVIGTAVVQKPGEQCPYLPALRVSGFEITPLFDTKDRVVELETNPVTLATDLPKYDKAKFDISYAIPTAPQSEDEALERGDPVPFLEHSVTSGGQLLDISTKETSEFAYWEYYMPAVGDGDDLELSPENDDLPITKIVGTTQHQVFWPRVIQPHWVNLEKFKGHVNEEDFRLRGYTYPAGTLLYLAYDMNEVLMTDGSVSYNLRLNFEGKIVRNEQSLVDAYENDGYELDEIGGHNHFWSRPRGAWLRVRSLFGSTTPYPQADFNDLFKASVE